MNAGKPAKFGVQNGQARFAAQHGGKPHKDLDHASSGSLTLLLDVFAVGEEF